MNSIITVGFLAISLCFNVGYASEHKELPVGNINIELRDVEKKEDMQSAMAGIPSEGQSKAMSEVKANAEDSDEESSVCVRWKKWSKRDRRCYIACLGLTLSIGVVIASWPLYFKPLLDADITHLSGILNYKPDADSEVCVRVNVKELDTLGLPTCVSNSADISQIARAINPPCLSGGCRVTGIARVPCNDDARSRRCDARLLQVSRNSNSVQSYGPKQNKLLQLGKNRKSVQSYGRKQKNG